MPIINIFPQKFQKDFESVGIDINDPQFGSWWQKNDHRQNAYDYNKKWESFLSIPRSKDEILDYGIELSSEFGFDANYK